MTLKSSGIGRLTVLLCSPWAELNGKNYSHR